jgi:hypothetical protein
VIFSLHKEGDPLRQFEYNGTLLLKDSSANRFSTQKVYYSYYEYNSKGQLTKLQDFNGGDKISREEIYSYENNVVVVKGTSYPSFQGGNPSSYEKKKYYDTKGSLIKSTYTVNGKTEITEYKLDDNGNWIWKTGGMTRKIEYYETSPATNKQTNIPVNNNTQLSLLLEENFDNNNNKWTIWDNESSAAQINNGNYRINIKQSNNYASWLGFPALATDQSKDFAIETKIFLNTTEKGNPYDSYWLLWGLGNDGKNFYAFGIYPEGKFQYGKLVNGSWNAMAGSITSSSVKAGVNIANVLRVEKKRDSIFFFVNSNEVYKAKYEQFNINNAGVGFQWNNKKTLDIDYLKIFKGSVSYGAISPEPQESDYQKKLTKAGNSNERADAIIDYYLAIKSMNYSSEQMETLLGQKFIQMMEIDYYGFYYILMSKRIKMEDVQLCMKASNVLTTEQRAAVKSLSKYTVDEFIATQNNTAKPAYPAGVPQPGYGWGKTVSSNKETANTSTVHKPIETYPATTKPVPVDELTQLKDAMNYIKGRWVYLSKQQKHFYVPKNYMVTSLTDQIMLKEILASSTYDSYKARNVFSVRYSDGSTFPLSVTELVKALSTNTNSYIVTTIYQCSGCLGQGGSWNNNTRKGATCTTCGGSGCVSSQDGGGYSNMPYVNFVY